MNRSCGSCQAVRVFVECLWRKVWLEGMGFFCWILQKSGLLKILVTFSNVTNPNFKCIYLNLATRQGERDTSEFSLFSGEACVLGVLLQMVTYSRVSASTSAVIFDLNMYEGFSKLLLQELKSLLAERIFVSLWRTRKHTMHARKNVWMGLEKLLGTLQSPMTTHFLTVVWGSGLRWSLVWSAVIAGSWCQTNRARWSPECTVPVVHIR